MMLPKPLRMFNSDARHYQMTCQASLFLYGCFFLGFDVPWWLPAAFIGATLTTQYFFTKALGLPHFDFRSPLISGLSLCLMLRTETIPLAIFCASLGIASKFLVRWRGKHIFNPTNFPIVFALLFLDGVWVSPGQWGSGAWVAFLIACLGAMVVTRATRSDTALAVIGFHAAILLVRALYLGDPLAIPLHQVQSGTLLVFAFFMISDPKTTPYSRSGRILFALLVCLVAGWIQFGLFRPNGLLFALAACSPFVPLIDYVLPGSVYRWSDSQRQPKGNGHEIPNTLPGLGNMPVPHGVR